MNENETQAAQTLSLVEWLKSQRMHLDQWLPHAIVLSLFCVANLVLPSSASALPRPLELTYGVFLAGGLVSEVAFTATIAALWNARLHHSLVVAVTLLVLVATTYVFGLALMADNVPLEPILLIYAIAIAGFIFLTLVLGVARLATGLCITHRTSLIEVPLVASSNYSIGYLLACTSAAAVIIAAVRFTLTGSKSIGGPPGWMVSAAAVYVAYATAIYLPCVWIALATRFRRTALMLLLAEFLLLAPFASAFMHRTIVKLNNDAGIAIYAFSLGQALSSILMWHIYRLCGYRLAHGQHRKQGRTRVQNLGISDFSTNRWIRISLPSVTLGSAAIALRSSLAFDKADQRGRAKSSDGYCQRQLGTDYSQQDVAKIPRRAQLSELRRHIR